MSNSLFKKEKKAGDGLDKKKTLIFVAVFILIFTGSLLYILKQNNFNLKTALGGDEETSASEEVSVTLGSDEESERNYLLFCCDSEKENLKFLWLVKIKMPDCVMTIKSLSPLTTIQLGSRASTISTAFATYGEEYLAESVESKEGIELDGYLGATTENFKQMINYFGSVNISVDEKVEYKGDFSLILVDGETGMKGDTLYRYLCYLGTLGDKGMRERSETLSEIFKAILKEKYIEKEDKIFSKMANAFMTDISIVDFSAKRENIEYILTNGVAEYIIEE